MGWPVKAPAACSHLCCVHATAVGEERAGGSWPIGMADNPSPRSHAHKAPLDPTTLWVPAWQSTDLALHCHLGSPWGRQWAVSHEGCCPPGLPHLELRARDCRFREQQKVACYRPAESLLSTGFPGQPSSAISVPPRKHGLWEALATQRYPASKGCCSGWACGLCPQDGRTLKGDTVPGLATGGCWTRYLTSLSNLRETGLGQTAVCLG